MRRVQELKTRVFSRTHNLLTAKERTSLDNIITTEIFSINEFLKSAQDYQLKVITPEFFEIVEQYENNKKKEEAELASRLSLAKTIPELLELTPREFEQWTAKLLEHLSYTNVTLTPQSGDKGIDVYAESDGKKIGVQCKKFKGVVTAPLIQSFLGALQTAEISSGIFITTGTFSTGAQKISEEANITLIDAEKIKGLIKSFPDELS